MGLQVFFVEDIRVSEPGDKAKASNPERILNVTGTFYPVTTDDKGKEHKGEAQSAGTKYITREDMRAEGYELNLATGRLVLPSGQRGRKPAPAMSQEAIEALLASVREGTDEQDDDES